MTPPGNYVCPHCQIAVELLVAASEPPAHRCHQKRSTWVALVPAEAKQPEGVLF